MPYDIVLPNLGFDSQSGRLIEWIKQVGDKVKKGEVLAVIESDKAEVEFESLAEGTIAELCAAEGDEVPVGSVIARLTQEEEQSHSDSVLPTSNTPASLAPRPELEATNSLETSQALALPKVRKAAKTSGRQAGRYSESRLCQSHYDARFGRLPRRQAGISRCKYCRA